MYARACELNVSVRGVLPLRLRAGVLLLVRVVSGAGIAPVYIINYTKEHTWNLDKLKITT